MTPEYLLGLADQADPGKLWQRGAFDRLDMPEDQRRQLDAGVALRRYADHIRRLRDLLTEGRSLLITPITENSTALKSVATPTEHARLRRPRPCDVPDGCTAKNCLGCGESSDGVPVSREGLE